jgi:threonine dehydratase
LKGNQISLQDIYLARKRISSFIRRTPLSDSPQLSKLTGALVELKQENLQITGAFKLRGAANKLISLSEEGKQRGVITVSSGNHGKAVSYMARKLGLRATIVVSEAVPENKREMIRDLGADLIVEGATADDAMDFADQMANEQGMTMVHPFDDLEIIAGQGTIGLEILEANPDVDTILVPLSGGGLMSGISFTVKTISPDVQVIGVSMDRGAAMVESLKAGRVVDINEEASLADALIGGLNRENQFTFPMVQKYVDSTILVSEDEIAAGMLFALREHQIVLEGGAAVGISALQAGKAPKLGKNVVIVLSGANVSLTTLQKIIVQ